MNAQPADSSLHWTMRIIGLLLAATCVFLLTRDVSHSTEALWFLGIGAGLGLITALSSWLPSRVTVAEAERVRA